MSEIEKMQRYIDRTKMKGAENYCLVYCEAVELGRKARNDANNLLDVISFAFNYGKAKGYRAAKAEVRK